MPESYFRDDRSEQDLLESGESGSEDGGSVQGGAEDISTSSSREVVSPRAVSNSRRKRKRKSSQSEIKKRTPSSSSNSAPASPVDEKPVILGTNLSPSLPVTIGSPSSLMNARSSSGSTVVTEGTKADSSTNSWRNVERKRSGSGSSLENIKSPKSTNEESVLKFGSAPGLSIQRDEQVRYQGLPQTPLSAPHLASVPGRGKGKAMSRTRLVNKFGVEATNVEREVKRVNGYRGQAPESEVAAKGPWGHINNG